MILVSPSIIISKSEPNLGWDGNHEGCYKEEAKMKWKMSFNNSLCFIKMPCIQRPICEIQFSDKTASRCTVYFGITEIIISLPSIGFSHLVNCSWKWILTWIWIIAEEENNKWFWGGDIPIRNEDHVDMPTMFLLNQKAVSQNFSILIFSPKMYSN